MPIIVLDCARTRQCAPRLDASSPMCYMWYSEFMRTAGIREIRQDLTSVLEDVRKGREVVITDRGRPIARIVPVVERQPIPDLSAFRERMGDLGFSLSQAIIDDRAD